MQYFIAGIEMEFFLPAVQSLKEKRALRQRLTERLQNRFSLSILECGEQDNLARLQLAAALLWSGEGKARDAGRAVLRAAEEIAGGEAELIHYAVDVY